MTQTADVRNGNDAAGAGGFDLSLEWRLLPQNGELLSQREILCGEFCSITMDTAEE